MKWFSALALRSFISGTFLTDGNSEWPGIGINCRGEDMIIPCLVKGSDHEVPEVAMSKASRDEFQWK